jgi:hypothetical protein
VSDEPSFNELIRQQADPDHQRQQRQAVLERLLPPAGEHEEQDVGGEPPQETAPERTT